MLSLQHTLQIWDRSERGIRSLEQRERIGSTSVSLQSVSVCNLTEAQPQRTRAPTIGIQRVITGMCRILDTQHTSP